MKKYTFLIIMCLFPCLALATTWNEPWMDEVISRADSLVRVDVTVNKPEAFSAKVTKHLAGRETPTEIRVNGYYLLEFRSHSVHETDFRFNPNLDYYLFLKRGKKEGQYSIATPTTGWAKVLVEGVNASYRHSYHQALVPENVYELSMIAIFNRLHQIDVDEKPIRDFVEAHLKKEPALLGKANGDPTVAEEFFHQHVALELFRYFGRPNEMNLIEPFLTADDYHVQISAARAIALFNTTEAKDRLMKFIENDQFGFAKIMAVWGLEHHNAVEYAERLEVFMNIGQDEETGFGGDFMDPRVGTDFPESVKSAVANLLDKWKNESSNQ